MIPFAKDFFGSPASGSFAYPVFLPDARIAAAEMYVTNSRGNGETGKVHFTASVDRGIRTLSGGQLTIQVEGPLAVQTNAAPELVIEDGHSARDIFSVVKEPPSGGPVSLELTLDSILYCALTIADGATSSNVVTGFGLQRLGALSKLRLNIVAVPQGPESQPGRDLTVTIRL